MLRYILFAVLLKYRSSMTSYSSSFFNLPVVIKINLGK